MAALTQEAIQKLIDEKALKDLEKIKERFNNKQAFQPLPPKTKHV